MAAVTVRFNDAALAQIALAAGQKDLRVRANRVLSAAKRNAPVDQGTLRNSLTVEYATVGGEAVARIGSNLSYAIYVHEGTGLYGPKRHLIRPRNGRVMVWPMRNNSGQGRRRYKQGRTASYAAAAYTRGMPGRPFLVQALDAAR